MSSIDDTQIMKTTLVNIDNVTVNPNFKEQFLAISSTFEEFSRELLGVFFDYVDDYILNIKDSAEYQRSAADQDEVRDALRIFHCLRN